MDVVSLLVAIGALFVAGLAYRHSVNAAKSEAADRREELDLIREQIEDERRRHEEQIALEHERRRDERRAELVAVQGSISGGADADLHTIHLTNGGRSTARDIYLVVVGEVGESLVNHRTRDLPPDTTTDTRIAIPRHVGRGQRDLVLRASWRDGAGEHDEALTNLRSVR